jgi:hypothetical protein
MPKKEDGKVSHLTTLVERFLKALENSKRFHGLNHLEGEWELRHHLANVIEYLYYWHIDPTYPRQNCYTKIISDAEIQRLVKILEAP